MGMSDFISREALTMHLEWLRSVITNEAVRNEIQDIIDVVKEFPSANTPEQEVYS